MFPEFAHNLPKNVQILPDFSLNLPQTFPKSFQDPPKLDPKGLLEPILEPCLKKIGFWAPKIQAKVAQERAKVAPARPNPIPNQAQDLPNQIFGWIFGLFFAIL